MPCWTVSEAEETAFLIASAMLIVGLVEWWKVKFVYLVFWVEAGVDDGGDKKERETELRIDALFVFFWSGSSHCLQTRLFRLLAHAASSHSRVTG